MVKVHSMSGDGCATVRSKNHAARTGSMRPFRVRGIASMKKRYDPRLIRRFGWSHTGIRAYLEEERIRVLGRLRGLVLIGGVRWVVPSCDGARSGFADPSKFVLPIRAWCLVGFVMWSDDCGSSSTTTSTCVFFKSRRDSLATAGRG